MVSKLLLPKITIGELKEILSTYPNDAEVQFLELHFERKEITYSIKMPKNI